MSSANPKASSAAAGSGRGPTTLYNPAEVGGLPNPFGRYQIVRPLGQGGMGTVYMAYDTYLDRQVALKVPHFGPTSSPEVLERFRREARTAAQLKHPNICQVYDVGQINGIHFLTMEYIQGMPLSQFLAATRTLPQPAVAALVRTVALALHAAHTQGIIHRDLKPSNIMINTARQPVIMDFGLARQFLVDGSALTQPGAVMGTPGYMAPEQVEGNPAAIGPGCDLYSLGVILYQLLTGRIPFADAGGAVALLYQTVHTPPPRPSQERPDVHPRLDAICLKLLAKQARDRYASMADLAAALGEYLGPTSQTADPELISQLFPEVIPTTQVPTLPAATPGPSPGRPLSTSPAHPAAAVTTQPAGFGIPTAIPVGTWPASGPVQPPASTVAVQGAATVPLTPVPGPAPGYPGGKQAVRVRWPWLAAGGAVLALGLLSLLFFLPGGEGTIQILVEAPGSEVTVQVDGDEISAARLSGPLQLRPGKHHLLVTGKQVETVNKSFTVEKGFNPALVVKVARLDQVAATGPATKPPADNPRPPEPPLKQDETKRPSKTKEPAGKNPANGNGKEKIRPRDDGEDEEDITAVDIPKPPFNREYEQDVLIGKWDAVLQSPIGFNSQQIRIFEAKKDGKFTFKHVFRTGDFKSTTNEGFGKYTYHPPSAGSTEAVLILEFSQEHSEENRIAWEKKNRFKISESHWLRDHKRIPGNEAGLRQLTQPHPMLQNGEGLTFKRE
jgi:serine/threonine protein kinase